MEGEWGEEQSNPGVGEIFGLGDGHIVESCAWEGSVPEERFGVFFKSLEWECCSEAPGRDNGVKK